MDKIISFIIPSFNVEQYLETCLKSFLVSDAMEQIEVIVVDDGSKDRTAEIANQYVTQFPETIRLIRKENGGHGSAINVGTKAATGKFLKIIDADDWIVSENLKKLIKDLEVCHADIILNPFHMVDMTTRKKEIRCMYLADYEKEYTLEEIMADWKSFDRCLTFHGMMYRRDFYQKYRHELPEKIFYEDQEYASIPCCHAIKIRPINVFFYQYLVGNTSQSVSTQNQLKRIDHIGQVALSMTKYYAVHQELSVGGKLYLAQKIEGVLLSYYTIACVVNPMKADGREKCCQFHKKVREICPEIVLRMKKKYLVYQMFTYIGMTEERYQKILDSKIYNLLRKNHARESE